MGRLWATHFGGVGGETRRARTGRHGHVFVHVHQFSKQKYITKIDIVGGHKGRDESAVRELCIHVNLVLFGGLKFFFEK